MKTDGLKQMKNNEIIIGTTAMKYWYPEFKNEPKDIDVLVESLEGYNREPGKEYLLNPIIFKNKDLYSKDGYLLPDVLLTLRASHVPWNIKWEHNVWCIQFLLKQGCKIDHKLFYELYEFWNTYHSKNKRSDLKMSKEEFFNNAINYDEAEHDYLHTLINPVPTYTKVLKDGCEVELDETKFHKLTYEEKLNFIIEETQIMCFERFRHLDYRVGYSKMLKKFILSHCPIWALIFLLENYIPLHLAKYNFIEQIEQGLKNASKDFRIK